MVQDVPTKKFKHLVSSFPALLPTAFGKHATFAVARFALAPVTFRFCTPRANAVCLSLSFEPFLVAESP